MFYSCYSHYHISNAGVIIATKWNSQERMVFEWLISCLSYGSASSYYRCPITKQNNIYNIYCLLIFNRLSTKYTLLQKVLSFGWTFVTSQQDNFLLCMVDGKQLIYSLSMHYFVIMVIVTICWIITWFLWHRNLVPHWHWNKCFFLFLRLIV